ncbi:MAG: PHP domain-containing protein [Synergistaceae bacterium]|nr:PHP domain-containing protein [Synergistaceae bacterium]
MKIPDLNAPCMEDRLAAASALAGGIPPAPVGTERVNNHIHTIYSFSPYSPAKAAYMARLNGLATAGIMDHDSIAGAAEFIAAGRAVGIAVTVGLECRVSMEGTPFEGLRLNNPDQKSVAYAALHGVPHGKIDFVQNFFAPYREKRAVRNRNMTGRLNSMFARFGIRLDYDADIAPISQAAAGGSVTERHILFALAGKLVGTIGRGEPLLDFLENDMGVHVAGDARVKMLDSGDPMYEYRLLGILKGRFTEYFYVDATDELPRVGDFVRFADEVGAIPAYAYLGDVRNSVTGDKKDQAFEDPYLDELVEWLSGNGFRAVTFMPTRNSFSQLDRVMVLCERFGLFQISGEDINSPFQPFICEALADPRFSHLVTAAWALIGHERAATDDAGGGMFSEKSIRDMPDLLDRIARYAAIGRASRKIRDIGGKLI